ncbi:IS5 family transposase, partial [Motilimonas pumila]
MGKSKNKISNWPAYNKALTQRGSVTFWIDDSARESWMCQEHHGLRGRGFLFTDTAIETALMIKGIFQLPLRALQGFIDSIFSLMDVPLRSPNYTSISKRAKTVEVKYRAPSRGAVRHIAIDSTGLKVFGEGEWKVRKHGYDKRRVWRKLHLAVDVETHDIISAEVSLVNVGDNEVLPTLINPLRRKISEVSADGAYDTKACHDVLENKGIKPLIPPRANAAFWEEGHPRNEAVSALKADELKEWK